MRLGWSPANLVWTVLLLPVTARRIRCLTMLWKELLRETWACT